MQQNHCQCFYLLLSLLLLFCMGLAAPPATAVTFDTSTNTTLKDNQDLTLSDPVLSMQAEQKMSYYHDLISLQQQIYMLKQLIEREEKNLSLSENLQKVGLQFRPSAPSQDACQQVPANLSCAEFYTDMYANFPPVGESLAGALPQQFGNSLSPVDLMPIEFLPRAVEKAPDDRPFLQWTNITCLNGECSGVVTSNASDSTDRYRIFVGDILPNGEKVEAITPQGVVLKSKKGTRTIDPAPAPALQALKSPV